MTEATIPHVTPSGKLLSTSPELHATGTGIDMARIALLADRATGMVEQIRAKLLAPEVRKAPPQFSTAQLAALCGVDRAHINSGAGRGALPPGQLTRGGGKRDFSPADARHWTRAYRGARMRPAGQKAVTIAIGNF